MERLCRKEDCTVSQTGRCLLNNDPETCPERLPAPSSTDGAAPISELVEALPSPAPHPKFPSSLTLSLSDSRLEPRSEYWHLIGILGAPDSGKTAALVS